MYDVRWMMDEGRDKVRNWARVKRNVSILNSLSGWRGYCCQNGARLSYSAAMQLDTPRVVRIAVRMAIMV